MANIGLLSNETNRPVIDNGILIGHQSPFACGVGAKEFENANNPSQTGGLFEAISPPWVLYPEYGPGDGFWRQAGEAWFVEVWQQYWKKLSLDEQADYFQRWIPAEEWKIFYFNKDFSDWLDSLD
jgi:hypothetical protein